MGNENSREAIEHGQQTAAYIKGIADRDKQKYKDEYHAKWAATRKKIAADRAATKRATPQSEELEEGEVLSQDGLPLRSKASSQQIPEVGDDLLKSFKPRKEPLKKPTGESEIHQSLGGKFDGLGHMPASQKDESLKQKKKPEKLSKLTTNLKDTTLPGYSTSASTSKTPTSAKPSSATASSSSAKRPATARTSTDDRSSGLSALPKIAKRSAFSSPQSPDRAEAQQLPSVVQERPPQWYLDARAPTSRGRNESNVDILLAGIRSQITKLQKPEFARDRNLHHKVFADIVDKLHKLAFVKVTPTLLKQHRVLHEDDGLPQLFDRQYSASEVCPWYIRADAKELYNKWCRQVFETDLLRGIIPGKPTSTKDGGDRNNDKIDEDYGGVVSPKFWGNGDLLNGQWFPTQLCTIRDGAHGATQAGVSGKAGDGAYSIIMSGGHEYPDEDHGEWVLYCGTDSTTGASTDNTKLMIDSMEKGGRPVRLIRSHNLRSQYAPQVGGFRYDGLYKVVSFKNLDGPRSTRQRHQFRLERCKGQDPIRGGDGPEKRPTEQEINAYRQDKHFRGF